LAKGTPVVPLSTLPFMVKVDLGPVLVFLHPKIKINMRNKIYFMVMVLMVED
jgi:hypothetical protein